MKAIKKILIVNRGEIAVRVIRTCRELGITSVAVFSDVDRTSLHVQLADEAYPLGGAAPKESYLDQKKVINIARQVNADAIHPGYGFLAENAAFAKLVEENRIIFIGPTSNAIKLMGDKTAARRLAKELNIPRVAGALDPITDEDEALRTVEQIGFPVMLKAAAGGGGKGMRIVRSREEFGPSLQTARSEAQTAFGDDRIYIEKYIDSPRHIEIQVLADTYGNTVYLGERECSIQRRHQKIIEESPSTIVDAAFRKRLGEAAVTLAKAAGYANAGTLEFLVDAQKNFYFLEMNTRLQVEHPVTEAITGLDLVKEQIRIAEGNKLPFAQNEIQLRGHAIECRICAEDPNNNFFPSTGILRRYRAPQGKVRVENGFQEGDQISVFYDSLLAKVIVWGRDREEALRSMKNALAEFAIDGVKTTIPFCQYVLNHQAFREGTINTRFINNHFTQSSLSTDEPQLELAAAITTVLLQERGVTTSPVINGEAHENHSRWKLLRQENMRNG